MVCPAVAPTKIEWTRDPPAPALSVLQVAGACEVDRKLATIVIPIAPMENMPSAPGFCPKAELHCTLVGFGPLQAALKDGMKILGEEFVLGVNRVLAASAPCASALPISAPLYHILKKDPQLGADTETIIMPVAVENGIEAVTAVRDFAAAAFAQSGIEKLKQHATKIAAPIEEQFFHVTLLVSNPGGAGGGAIGIKSRADFDRALEAGRKYAPRQAFGNGAALVAYELGSIATGEKADVN
jgi:hypothetical protein